MVSAGMQMLGTALGLIGWIGAIVVCAMPMWRVSAFIGSNIVTSQTIWEGIWMNCVVQSTGQMQCKIYDSMLALSSDLQAARALTILSIVVGIMGILLSVAGGKCTNCVEDEASKAKVGVASGVTFIVAGVLCLIPVCWTANTVIQDSTTRSWSAPRRESSGPRSTLGGGPPRSCSSEGACCAATALPKRISPTTPDIRRLPGQDPGLRAQHLHLERTMCERIKTTEVCLCVQLRSGRTVY